MVWFYFNLFGVRRMLCKALTCATATFRSYKSWCDEAAFAFRVSCHFPDAGGIVQLQNGWRCAVALNVHSWCVALRVLDATGPHDARFVLLTRSSRGQHVVDLVRDGLCARRGMTPGLLPLFPAVERLSVVDAASELDTLAELAMAHMVGIRWPYMKDVRRTAIKIRQVAFELPAIRIQRCWRRCVSNPAYFVCKRRLAREHGELVCTCLINDGHLLRQPPGS